jgi:hypothetical protein
VNLLSFNFNKRMLEVLFSRSCVRTLLYLSPFTTKLIIIDSKIIYLHKLKVKQQKGFIGSALVGFTHFFVNVWLCFCVMYC